MPDKQNRTRRQFTPEFKRDAVELVRTSGRPIAEIARELAGPASGAASPSKTLARRSTPTGPTWPGAATSPTAPPSDAPIDVKWEASGGVRPVDVAHLPERRENLW